MKNNNSLIFNGSLNLKEIIRRICLGSIAGAFIGILELWFYEFSVQHGIAAICSGAAFGIMLGVFGSVISQQIWSSILFGIVAGALAGMLWWSIAKADVNIMISAGIGVVIGCLVVCGERPWKSK